MGQKVNPLSFRLGVTKDWRAHWLVKIAKYKDVLREDYQVRKFIGQKLGRVGVERVEIERSGNNLRVVIYTSRPGFIIGRGGEGIEQLRKGLERKIFELRGLDKAKRLPAKTDKPSSRAGAAQTGKIQLKVDVEEVRRPETNATIVAQGMAEQIEKRTPFRRVLKQALEKVMGNKEVQGAKVMVAGRLDGSEMSRTEWLAKGKIPLHTLRADIDYGTATAYNTYGTVGVKVWIYKGEVFNKQ